MWHIGFVKMDLFLNVLYKTRKEKIMETEHTYTENDSLIIGH